MDQIQRNAENDDELVQQIAELVEFNPCNYYDSSTAFGQGTISMGKGAIRNK